MTNSILFDISKIPKGELYRFYCLCVLITRNLTFLSQEALQKIKDLPHPYLCRPRSIMTLSLSEHILLEFVCAI
jgi:hypothetical protein